MQKQTSEISDPKAIQETRWKYQITKPSPASPSFSDILHSECISSMGRIYTRQTEELFEKRMTSKEKANMC